MKLHSHDYKSAHYAMARRHKNVRTETPGSGEELKYIRLSVISIDNEKIKTFFLNKILYEAGLLH